MPAGSSLNLAELCIQRADYRQARSLLEKRLGMGGKDFKTQNLYESELKHTTISDLLLTYIGIYMYNKIQ